MISCNVTAQRIGKHNSLVRQVASFLVRGKMGHRTELGVDKDMMGDLVILDFANGRISMLIYCLCPLFVVRIEILVVNKLGLQGLQGETRS
jgi:hypothetical protein